jgi:hypothetical protein
MFGIGLAEGLAYCIAAAATGIQEILKVTESERERQVRRLRERGQELFWKNRFEEADVQFQAAARLNRLRSPWEFRSARHR